MTPEAQRIAIAELCGWKFQKIPGEFRYVSIARDGGVFATNFGDVRHLPDYLNDLNAMHEAEKILTEHQRCLFCGAIANTKYKLDDLWNCTHATAAQRAEAFLRTLGLWKEQS